MKGIPGGLRWRTKTRFGSLTYAKQKYIEIEFDSRELEGRFKTEWWKKFAQLASAGASSGDYEEIMDYLHVGSGLACGTVYGVSGIDCEHGCRSEYHPAYAVAIQIDDSKGANSVSIDVLRSSCCVDL